MKEVSMPPDYDTSGPQFFGKVVRRVCGELNTSRGQLLYTNGFQECLRLEEIERLQHVLQAVLQQYVSAGETLSVNHFLYGDIVQGTSIAPNEVAACGVLLTTSPVQSTDDPNRTWNTRLLEHEVTEADQALLHVLAAVLRALDIRVDARLTLIANMALECFTARDLYGVVFETDRVGDCLDITAVMLEHVVFHVRVVLEGGNGGVRQLNRLLLYGPKQLDDPVVRNRLWFLQGSPDPQYYYEGDFARYQRDRVLDNQALLAATIERNMPAVITARRGLMAGFLAGSQTRHALYVVLVEIAKRLGFNPRMLRVN